jgi:hypothetical protein
MRTLALLWLSTNVGALTLLVCRYAWDRTQRASHEGGAFSTKRVRRITPEARFLGDLLTPQPLRPRVVPCDGIGVFVRASCEAEASEIVAISAAFGAREKVA